MTMTKKVSEGSMVVLLCIFSWRTIMMMYLCLETRVHGHQEGILACQSEHALLCKRTLDVIVLNKHVFLQHLQTKGEEG